jgi:subtilisin family serine protease
MRSGPFGIEVGMHRRVVTLGAIAALVVGTHSVAAAGDPASRGSASRPADGVLVKWTADAAPLQRAGALAAAGGARVDADLPLPRTQRLHLPPGVPAERVATALENNPNVVWAEPDHRLQPTSDDPGFALQWGLDNTGQVVNGRAGAADVDVQMPEAQALAAGAQTTPVVVAIVDSGVDIGHPDLATAIFRDPDEVAGNGVDDDGNGFVDDVSGYDFAGDDPDVFDDLVIDEHGTHVAGTVGAVADNGVGIAGVAPVALLPVKFIDADGGQISDAIKAIDYARRQGAGVINASFGGPDSSQALEDAITASGAVFVAAAGNESSNNDLSPQYPASSGAANVLSVAAVGNDGSLAPFSNRGLLSVDVGAPGVDVVSTVPSNLYEYFSGTSMAAPHVAGAAALVRSVRPDLSPGEVVALIEDTVRPLPSLEGTTSTGGLVDAAAAVERALAGAQPTPQQDVVPPDLDGSSGEDDAVAPDEACPDGIPWAGFLDTAGSVHRYAIDCVVDYGLASGTSATTFSPQLQLTRGQVASLLAGLVERAGRLPASAPDAFTDDNGSVHEPNINRLAALGVLRGTGATTYSPSADITRGQLASLLVGVQEFLLGEPLRRGATPFVDIYTNVHRENIEKAFTAGLVNGTSQVTYSPGEKTTRAQAASVVANQLQALVAAGVVESKR